MNTQQDRVSKCIHTYELINSSYLYKVIEEAYILNKFFLFLQYYVKRWKDVVFFVIWLKKQLPLSLKLLKQTVIVSYPSSTSWDHLGQQWLFYNASPLCVKYQLSF